MTEAFNKGTAGGNGGDGCGCERLEDAGLLAGGTAGKGQPRADRALEIFAKIDDQ
jgi:hypothetical protein